MRYLPLLLGALACAVGMIAFPHVATVTREVILVIIVGLGLPVIGIWCVQPIRHRLRRRWLARNGTPVHGRVVQTQRWASSIVTVDDEEPCLIVVEVLSQTGPIHLEIRQTLCAGMMPEVGDDVRVLYDPRRPRHALLVPGDSGF